MFLAKALGVILTMVLVVGSLALCFKYIAKSLEDLRNEKDKF